MFDRVGQKRGRVAHDARRIAARVHDHVPAAPLQRAEPAVAVAVQLLDLGEQLGFEMPTIEERHLVAAPERDFDKVSAEELSSRPRQVAS